MKSLNNQVRDQLLNQIRGQLNKHVFDISINVEKPFSYIFFFKGKIISDFIY